VTPGMRVVMVDRYAARAQCTCPARRFEPSWFNGLRGKVTSVAPFMVLIDGESTPMRFDARDFDEVTT
jgi:hypothetical protein